MPNEILLHTGVAHDENPPGRGSGRYAFGSGLNPGQRHSGKYPAWNPNNELYGHNFVARAQYLRSEGLTDTEIAKVFDMNTTTYRARYAVLNNEEKKKEILRANDLKSKGYSNVKIGEILGHPESTIRNYLKDGAAVKTTAVINTADALKKEVAANKYLDVGPGTEIFMGVSRSNLDTAIEVLKEQGYKTHNVYIPQIGSNSQMTTVKVLAGPDSTSKEVNKNRAQIKAVGVYSEDGGNKDPFRHFQYPAAVDSSRVQVRYGDKGGVEKDGVIEIRPGVPDLSLGNSKYAQVRINVDGTHYLKGMAMYALPKDMPDGVDIIFNTNKKTGTPMLGDKDHSVLKPLKSDPNNPFGANIKPNGQSWYTDPKTGEKKLSAINKVKEEGDWNEWSKNLPSQFLSKQNVPLAKKQLNLAYLSKREEYEEIMSLTNPAVKKRLLGALADRCDASARELKAAPLPRQRYQVILPITDMKDNEIYAPNYNDGEQVALVRYPHGGIFEIPVLKVNNKQKTANALIHNAQDAVGINSKVAERLSGADFDGDTVMVIPTKNIKIRTSEPLKGLVGFDPKAEYPLPDGKKAMSERTKQKEMGVVSNLITDMTLRGATSDELARAVRHSMVVIDAVKHRLDYKKSYLDNDIESLKKEYQMHPDGTYGGSSTLISRAKSEVQVPKRMKYVKTDPETGEKIFRLSSDQTYMKRDKVRIKDASGRYLRDADGNYIYKTDPKSGKVIYEDTGKIMKRTQKSTKMDETSDAYSLSSGTLMEDAYANYANQMKALGNLARKSYLETPNLVYHPDAAKKYAPEVSSLKAKLNEAYKNSPRERQAQILANEEVKAMRANDPDMTKDQLKKVKSAALNRARDTTGAIKKRITIGDREWEAIQAGAVSNNTLEKILNNTDIDIIKEKATPRSRRELTPSQKSLIRSMEASGYSTADIAKRLGVSSSTINRVVNGAA